MLFQSGNFKLSSGLMSNFKIECDHLDSNDWETLAMLGVCKLPFFKEVIAVPTGGFPFQKALCKYRTRKSPIILVCDDVYTTGKSIREIMNRPIYRNSPVHGVVAFARNETPQDITAVWSLV